MAPIEMNEPRCGRWCKEEYRCDVAIVEPPDDYFFWILDCYTLLEAGLTIDNDWLDLDEWLDLGELKRIIQNCSESKQAKDIRDGLLDAMVRAAAAGAGQTPNRQRRK